MHRTVVLAASLIALILALAACGDDPAPDPADIAGINSCDLVTRDDAEDVLGQDVGSAEESIVGDRFHECLYRSEGGTGAPSTVSVQARIDSTREEYDLLLTGNCPVEIGGPSPIEGLGEAAHQCVQTFAYQDGVIVSVLVIDNEDPAGGTARQPGLAAIAVDRLPQD
jgi:hypothetical protein